MKFIAELCQNHNGSFQNILEMTKRCAENGADIIKLQYIFSETLAYRPRFENGFIKNKKTVIIKRPYNTEKSRLKKLEVSNHNIKKFVKLCKKLNVEPSITCFTRRDIDKIKNLGFNTVKVASYDCASFQFIKELKNKFKNIIISTGATFDDEIKHASSILGKKDFIFLHCVTIYPTPLKNLNLERINFLKKYTKNVGFSDHSIGYGKNRNLASLLAIFLGAKYIERHITILDKTQTKDGKVSIEPHDIRELKNFSKLSLIEKKKYLNCNYKFNLNLIRGKSIRQLSHEELLNRDYYRGRFVSKKGKRNIYNWEEIPI